MKKLRMLGALLALLTATSFTSVTAFADTVSEPATATTQFTYTLKNEPTFSVTIPGSVEITDEGTPMTISATDVANLDGKKVSVTIAGTDYFRNQMVLTGKTETGANAAIRYQFVDQDGNIIETTGTKDQVNGVEVASFTEDGDVTFSVRPVLAASSSIKTGVTYTGSMTYNIALVDAE